MMKNMLWNFKIHPNKLNKQIHMRNTNQTKHYPGDFSVLLKSYSSIHWPEFASVICKLQHILSHNHYVQNVVEEKIHEWYQNEFAFRPFHLFSWELMNRDVMLRITFSQKKVIFYWFLIINILKCNLHDWYKTVRYALELCENVRSLIPLFQIDKDFHICKSEVFA